MRPHSPNLPLPSNDSLPPKQPEPLPVFSGIEISSPALGNPSDYKGLATGQPAHGRDRPSSSKGTPPRQGNSEHFVIGTSPAENSATASFNPYLSPLEEPVARPVPAPPESKGPLPFSQPRSSDAANFHPYLSPLEEPVARPVPAPPESKGPLPFSQPRPSNAASPVAQPQASAAPTNSTPVPASDEVTETPRDKIPPGYFSYSPHRGHRRSSVRSLVKRLASLFEGPVWLAKKVWVGIKPAKKKSHKRTHRPHYDRVDVNAYLGVRPKERPKPRHLSATEDKVGSAANRDVKSARDGFAAEHGTPQPTTAPVTPGPIPVADKVAKTPRGDSLVTRLGKYIGALYSSVRDARLAQKQSADRNKVETDKASPMARFAPISYKTNGDWFVEKYGQSMEEARQAFLNRTSLRTRLSAVSKQIFNRKNGLRVLSIAGAFTATAACLCMTSDVSSHSAAAIQAPAAATAVQQVQQPAPPPVAAPTAAKTSAALTGNSVQILEQMLARSDLRGDNAKLAAKAIKHFDAGKRYLGLAETRNIVGNLAQHSKDPDAHQHAVDLSQVAQGVVTEFKMKASNEVVKVTKANAPYLKQKAQTHPGWANSSVAFSYKL